MMEIRRLDKTFLNEYKKLSKTVLDLLQDKSWFIPFDEDVIDSMFEEDSSLIVYGCIIDGVLAAVSMLDLNWEEFIEIGEAASIDLNKKGAEMGGSMVLPAFRGQNLMLEMNRALLEEAKKNQFSFLLATAHPDNKASNTSLQKLGFVHKNTIIRTGKYVRHVYAMEL